MPIPFFERGRFLEIEFDLTPSWHHSRLVILRSGSIRLPSFLLLFPALRTCNCPGYIARTCTVGLVSRNSPQSKVRPVVGHLAIVLGNELPSHICSVGKAMLHCGCKIPVIACACVSHDNGCNRVVVRRSLVTESQLTGKNRVLMLMDQSLTEVQTQLPVVL